MSELSAANPAVGATVREDAIEGRILAMSEEVRQQLASQPVLPGRVSGADPQLLALLDVLAEMFDRWTTEAQHRQRGANRGELFGPKMMILAAEGSVLLGCADELRAAVLKFGESQDSDHAIEA